VTLLNGRIWLDADYDSGIPGSPGTRFVIDLGVPPLELSDHSPPSTPGPPPPCYGAWTSDPISAPTCPEARHIVKSTSVFSSSSPRSQGDTASTSGGIDREDSAKDYPELPENLNILFVDDDFILRKLFSRCIKKVAPTWIVREAGSGEAALKLVEDESITFDVIFMVSAESWTYKVSALGVGPS